MLRRTAAACLLLAIAASGCGTPVERAMYEVPTGDTRIVVERRATQRVLAEYRRVAALEMAGRRAAQLELRLDTGGYSRANLYRLTETAFLLRDADASYSIDIAARTIARDPVRRKEGQFLGSFDTDAANTWRFISAARRAELPTEFHGQ